VTTSTSTSTPRAPRFARLARFVPEDEQVRVNVTTDFEGAVRAVIVDDPEYAAA